MNNYDWYEADSEDDDGGLADDAGLHDEEAVIDDRDESEEMEKERFKANKKIATLKKILASLDKEKQLHRQRVKLEKNKAKTNGETRALEKKINKATEKRRELIGNFEKSISESMEQQFNKKPIFSSPERKKMKIDYEAAANKLKATTSNEPKRKRSDNEAKKQQTQVRKSPITTYRSKYLNKTSSDSIVRTALQERTKNKQNTSNNDSDDISDSEKTEYFKIISQKSSLNNRFKIHGNETIIRINSDSFDKFVRTDNSLIENVRNWYVKCFDAILRQLSNKMKINKRDYVGIKISIPTMENNKPIGLYFREFQTYSGQIISDTIAGVMQSNSKFTEADLLEISITSIENREGGGGRSTLMHLKGKFEDIMELKKRSILNYFGAEKFYKTIAKQTFNYNDKKCLARSIILGKIFANIDSNKKQFKLFVQNNYKEIELQTDTLIKKALGVDPSIYEGPNAIAGVLNDLHKFNKITEPNYQIYLYNDIVQHKNTIFKGLRQIKKIYLYHFVQYKHFIALVHPKSFFGMNYMCDLCDKIMSSKKHTCSAKCPCCFNTPPCKTDKPITFADFADIPTIRNNSDDVDANYMTDQNELERLINKKCHDCHRFFRSESCFQNHKEILENGSNWQVCKRYQICAMCLRFVDNLALQQCEEYHDCGERYCSHCKSKVPFGHKCFVRKLYVKPPKRFIFYFFDIESTQNTMYPENEENLNTKYFTHVPNLLVSHKVCHNCVYIIANDFECDFCGARQKIFEGASCVVDFLNYCTKKHPNIPKKNTIVFSHNGKAYDMQFITSELSFIDKNAEIKIILNGHKILKIIFNRFITFIDSYSIIPIGLAKFPSAFGFCNMTKFDYPIYFNTFENYDYIGPIPDKKYYTIIKTSTNPKQLQAFHEWHSKLQETNYIFNNREELIKYCVNDVELLRRGCTVFLKYILNLAEVNPFIGIFTLPQLAITIFKKNFLKENILGLMPYEYSLNKLPQSDLCKMWLCYINFLHENPSERENGNIVEEVQLHDCGFFVDGYSSKSNTVYMFHGCLFHMHPNCNYGKASYQRKRITEPTKIKSNQFNFLYTNSRFQQTIAREARVASLGYSVISIWECDFYKQFMTNPKLYNMIKMHSWYKNKHERLKPCDAFHGGRVECYKMHHKIKKNERIRYFDFNSMYPAVMTFGTYCIGHPVEVYNGEFECKNKFPISRIETSYGLIKCSILPPNDLLIPLLPVKISGKLIFALCRTCAENCNITQKCEHDEKDKCLISTWSLCEVRMALKYGYKIVTIFEVWIYDTLTYNPKKKIDGIFNEFQQTFIKLKIEATGWPIECLNNDEKKLEYVRKFQEKNFIDIDPSKIKFDPSQRLIAKLICNQAYGKMAQRDRGTETVVLNNPEELQYYLNSPYHKIQNIFAPNENYIYIALKHLSLHDSLEFDMTEDELPIENLSKKKCRALFNTAERKRNDLLHCKPENAKLQNSASLISAIQTTCLGRLKLFEILHKLGPNLLYADTDSVFFIENINDPHRYIPPIGFCVGELTDELSEYKLSPDDDPFISQFVTIAPKAYAYTVHRNINDKKGIQIIKQKGYQLSNENLNVISFETYLNLLKGDIELVETKTEKIHLRDHFNIETGIECKKLQFTYDKRIVNETFDTIPFGFIQN